MHRDNKERRSSPTRQTSSTPKSAKAHGLKLCSVVDKPEEVVESLGNDGPEQMGGEGTWDMTNILQSKSTALFLLVLFAAADQEGSMWLLMMIKNYIFILENNANTLYSLGINY